MATIGVVLYIAAMWIAGVMQGLMWRAVNPDGTLTYAFVESVKATYPFYAIRLLGGIAVPRAACSSWPTTCGRRWRGQAGGCADPWRPPRTPERKRETTWPHMQSSHDSCRNEH